MGSCRRGRTRGRHSVRALRSRARSMTTSGTLRGLQSTVETAAPGSKWSGGAANAYGAANTEHGRVLGQMAGLDQRLAAHVDQSAEVVAAGRRNLDAVRQWVVDAAATVPPGQA